MTAKHQGQPTLPPDAKDEILNVLFANMEISGDAILCLRLPSAIPQNAPRIEEQRLRTTRAYGTLDVS